VLLLLGEKGDNMKKIICVLLALVMCLSLCACAKTTIVDNTERTILRNVFVVLEEFSSNDYIVFHKDTNIVYIFDNDGYGGYLCPYQIYKDGVIYGAVYENGEIVLVPYAMGITWDMVNLATKYLD
jgi:hypothetical protein